MNGLAAYRIPRYADGGAISGPLSSVGTLGGLNAPIGNVMGFDVTPLGVLGVLSNSTPLGYANMTLGAINALSSMISAQQDPAPVEEASVNTIADVAVSPVANPNAPVETAISAPSVGLAAMTQAEQAQQQAQQEAPSVDPSIAETVAAIADMTDAEAGAAAAAAAAAGTSASGGGGDASGSGSGDSPSGPDGGPDGDPSSAGDSSDDSYARGGLASYGAPMNRSNMMREIRYQGGGMTPVAQAVAGQGRMGDNMMVHMNPMEVAGLQALARSQGTSMTINPQTGMPEAFNLGAFLPTLLGLGLSAATGGAATPLIAGLSNPVAIGLGTGALTAAATGSLKKGLMAGLGAYGGAGLGEGLVGSAAAAPPPGMDGALGSGVTSTPTLPGADAAAGSYQSPFGSGTLTGSAPSYGLTGSTPSAAMGADALGGGLNIPAAPSGSMNLTGTLPAEQGFQIGASQGARALPPSTPGMFDNMAGKDILKYGSAAYSGTSALAQPEYVPPKSTAMLRPYTYKFNPVTGAYDRVAGDTSERLYGEATFTPGPVTEAAQGGLMDMNDDVVVDMAGGGLAAFKQGGRPKSRPLMGKSRYDFMGSQDSMPTLSSVEKNFAKGGRFLVGDGDGMSDDIPAVIAGKQPARLADGEFVIPADVVSHLGNGSSKAGAERLHDMMRKIRKERTGREKQAPAVKAEKYMPA